MTKTVEVTNPTFNVGDKSVARFEVHPITFAKFAECVKRANEKSTMDGDVAKLLQRERYLIQLKAIGSDGATIVLDEGNLAMIPIQYAKQLRKMSMDDGSKPGKILSEGDGIATPILYQLGTPISSGNGKDITEIEFMAKTYGDIEDVLMSDTQIEKTMALIRMARPVGVELIALPSWAENQITMPDGTSIMIDILPGFIE